jgi:hypothetical protein
MKLPPYEIPEQDADLWGCGTVLTGRPRAPSPPLPPLDLTAQRTARAERHVTAQRKSRANYVEWLHDRIAGRTDPSRVSYQPTPAEATARLEAARVRWGDAEYEAAVTIVAARVKARMAP